MLTNNPKLTCGTASLALIPAFEGPVFGGQWCFVVKTIVSTEIGAKTAEVKN